MRFFISFLILFFVGNLNLQETRTKSKKKPISSTPPSYISLPKEDRKIIYSSWIIEEASFPSELPIEAKEIQPIENKPLENLIKNPSKKIDNESSNKFTKFFLENQKIILVGLAILLFAIYQFRKTGIYSSSKVARRTFSRLKNK